MKLKFELNEQEIGVVMKGLQKLPYEEVFALIPKLQEQGTLQIVEIQKQQNTQQKSENNNPDATP